MNNKLILTIFLLTALLSLNTVPVRGQLGAFTYQGSLKAGGVPANGSYDFRVTFYDVATGGESLGGTEVYNVQVANGIFTIGLPAPLNVFGNGDIRFIEIAVRPAGGAGAFETLTPRQLITSAPYAVRSLRTNFAEVADNAGTAQFANQAQTAVTATTATNVAGTVALANGGTGATNAGGARTNLGLGSLATVTPTGAADATKFLRGDNVWADAPIYFNATLTHSNTATSTPGFYYPNGTVTRSVSPNGYESFFILPRACRFSDFKVTVIGYGSSFSIQRTFEINYTGSPLSTSPPNVALSITLANRSGAVESGSTSATFDVPALNFIRLTQRVTGLSSDNSTAYVSFTCR